MDSKIANEYDQRHGSTLDQLRRIVHEKKDFIGVKQGDRLLDYACGTGMISRALAQDVGECIGIDLSENMVGAYNAKAKAQGATREAFQGNFADPKAAALSDAKFFNFDAAGVGLGWHHLDEGELVAKKLVERLKPGGVFFILDFVPSSLSVEAAAGRGVKHDGFSEEQMRSLFEGAGAGKAFSYELIPETISFPGIHGANDGHDHGHGHGHNHGHNHEHGHGHGHSHEHAREQGQLGDRTLKIFIARGSKL